MYSLQAFSSDWSLHSYLSLQNSSLSIHSPLPQDNLPSGHTGSSVFRIGSTFRGSADQHCAAVICWVASNHASLFATYFSERWHNSVYSVPLLPMIFWIRYIERLWRQGSKKSIRIVKTENNVSNTQRMNSEEDTQWSCFVCGVKVYDTKRA